MNPTISIRLNDSHYGPGMRFSATCERSVVEEARGRSFPSDGADYDAAYREFLSNDLVRQDVHEYDGAIHVALLYRRRPGAYVLHSYSTSAEFPHERYDLDEANAAIYVQECRETHDADYIRQRFWELQGEALTERDVYSPKQLAERWAVSADLVRRAIRRGELEAFHPPGGKLLRIRAVVVKAYETARLPRVVTAGGQAKQKAAEDLLSAHRAKLSARSARQRRATKALAGHEGA